MDKTEQGCVTRGSNLVHVAKGGFHFWLSLSLSSHSTSSSFLLSPSPIFITNMSDFEDIDDELLELAGATEKKRKKRQASSSKPSSAKRRKAE